TFLEPTVPTGTWHERVATPSMCTVQAPQRAIPQPYLVPVSPIVSRNTQSKGALDSTSTLEDFPLMARAIMVVLPNSTIRCPPLDQNGVSGLNVPPAIG